MSRPAVIIMLALAAHVPLHAQAKAWRDASPHKVQFVAVEPGVQLEVLDWGGSGRPLVLLAGAGCTAHIYDDFAPRLKRYAHVYGITRRGVGASSRPGRIRDYKEERLAEDVVQVMGALHLTTPLLIGHSMAGGELTQVGALHSDLVGGLVYLDAASDPGDFPASDPAYMTLFRKLPEPMRQPPPTTDADLKSVAAYREWQRRTGEAVFPEGELLNTRRIQADGSIGDYTITPGVWDALGKGAMKRDYSHIAVPVLAMFPSKGKSRYEPKNDGEREAIDAFDAATQAFIRRWKTNLQKAPGSVRIVDVPGANHYIFLSNPDDVLREVRSFLRSLPHSHHRRT